MGIFAPMAFGEPEQSIPAMTLQQAIEKALQRDVGVKKAESEIERTEELRNQAAKKLEFMPVIGGYNYQAIKISWNSLLSADLNWRWSKKSLEMARDSLVLKVCEGYWNVQAARDKVAVQEKIERKALVDLQNVRAGLQAGTIAPSQLIFVESRWQQEKNNLAAAQKTLDSAYSDFNQLVRLAIGDRPVLTDNPDYEPLDITNLDYEVERVIEKSPTIWLAQETVTLKEWAASILYDSTGNYIPFNSRQITVQQAELDVANAKDIMSQVTRSLYYQIKSLEDGYASAHVALKMAQEKLRVEQSRFDAGMATKAEVEAAEVALEQARQAISDLTRQHAYLKLAFEKPWAASGGGSGASNGSSSPGATGSSR